jgi:hypothetical protein
MILVDVGPLVAFISKGDQWHKKCLRMLRRLEEPLGTVWPVVTEAMYLLGLSYAAQDALWQMLDRGALQLFPLGPEDVPRMRALMGQYKDLPMDLADAALVRVAEREGIRRIFTVDASDFRVCRPEGGGTFRVIP